MRATAVYPIDTHDLRSFDESFAEGAGVSKEGFIKGRPVLFMASE
jgi:hypothetical protein